MNRKKLTSVAIVLVAACVLLYMFHDVYKANYKKYDTETVVEETHQETVNIEAFVVRDEQYIDSTQSGTIVPLVADGNRVARDDAVARVCSSPENAADYANLIKCREELERYKQLSEQTELNSLDMEKLNEEIDKEYTNVLNTINRVDYGSLEGEISELENSLARKQILTNGAIDFSKKFTELNKQIEALEKKSISTSEVLAPLSGYFISNIDGYEKTLPYDSITSVTASDIEAAISDAPTAVTGKMGKIVGSYKWYLATTIDSKYSLIIHAGDSLKVNMPYYGYSGVNVTVESISSEKSGKLALILSCDMMNESYANMRVVDCELVLDEHTGYRVNSKAIRHITDSDGNGIDVVYIIRGNIMNARRIDILYDAEDYVIISENTERSGGYSPVKLYDEVIVKGRNLENGKSVG